MKNLFRLIGFLARSSDAYSYSKASIAFVVLASVLAGAVSTGLLALINAVLSDLGSGRFLAIGFIVLCALLPISRFVSNYLLIRLAQGITFDLRMGLSRKILSAPLRHLENVGPSRILASLTDDIMAITGSLVQIPLLFLHTTVILGCLGYMAWLSWQLFLVVLGFVAVGIATYQLPLPRALRHFRLSREGWDKVLESFRGITEGTKELKIHRPRREALMTERLEPAASIQKHHNIVANVIYGVVNSWGQVLFFILIGLILFVFPDFMAIAAMVSTGYVLAILYMLTPLDVVMNSFPGLGRAMIAVEKVEKLSFQLDAAESDSGDQPLLGPDARWRELRLDGVTHTYYREDADDTFTMGPIDLTFRAGELVFIVGGNGSGKTTLAKLIMGLYTPEGGRVLLDGEPVDDRNRDSFRQLFTAVFSDFYLFDSLLGIESDALDERSMEYLEKLHLARKVKVSEGELSTIDLSQGQRKRLALLTAYLEDRDIYVFDEWAADQDPVFKQIFYLQLLPELHRRGKTVLVISHDDRYYHVADRIVKLDYGQIVYDGEGQPLLETSDVGGAV